MFDFRRVIRKSRRWIRARFWFSYGALNALAHLRDWAEYQKSEAEKIDAEIKDLFEGTEDRALYLAVGSALTSWATMEEPMVIILALLLRTESQKAGLILYSTINFNVWISVIDELFAIDAIYFSFKPKWNKLAERLRRLKDDRDRIAHHAVKKKDADASAFEETTLRPADMDTRQKTQKYKPMATDDITGFSAKVSQLAHDLIALAQAMAASPDASPKKSPE